MILCVGNINTDILLPVDRLPEPHEKMTCGEGLISFGGAAANTAWWIAALGLPAALAGAVGDDGMGRDHLRALEGAGVDVRWVQSVQGVPTGLAVVFSRGREKRMVRVPGANLMCPFRGEAVAGRRVVYLSGAAGEVLARYAEEAKEEGALVVCGRHGAREPAVANLCDGFVLNSDEALEMTGAADPEEAVRALDAGLSAVTLPGGGCLVSDGVHVTAVPAREMEPVDRTGGGDAFAAGYLAGLALGLEPAARGRWGNMLAEGVIAGRGARPGITIPEPLQKEISSLI